MAHTITVASGAAALNQFVSTFDRQIFSALRQNLEFERDLPFAPCAEYYTAPNVSLTGGIQAYQSAFTPNNAETWDEVTNKLRPIKLDMEFLESELQDWLDTYYVEWFESGKKESEWNYPKFIMNNVLIPLISEQINTLSWGGSYVAPTAGVAGPAIAAQDGFAKVIADALLASNITAVATGVPTVGAEVTWVENFVKSLPLVYRQRGGTIFCSFPIRDKYLEDWRQEFGMAAGNLGNDNRSLTVYQYPNIRLIPVAAMGTSNRLIFVPSGTNNMIVGTRNGYPTYFNFNFVADVRVLKVYGTIYRFYGFKYWNHLYVNDQA